MQKCKGTDYEWIGRVTRKESDGRRSKGMEVEIHTWRLKCYGYATDPDGRGYVQVGGECPGGL